MAANCMAVSIPGRKRVIVYRGVEKGIEKYSRILMPILLVLIIGIGVFSLTLKTTAADGTVRSGLDGLKVYVIPDFTGMTLGRFVNVLIDAMGQLFFSISVAMGIMVAYGSYAKKETNLVKSINQIEFFRYAGGFPCRIDDHSRCVYLYGYGRHVRRSRSDVCVSSQGL